MMTRKWLAVAFMVLVMSVSVMTGCGNEKGGNTPGASDGNPDAGAEETLLDTIKSRGKLIVGVKYDTKLFGLKNPANNEVEGFDVDIAKALAKSILGDETKIELKEVTSKTRIPMLDNNEIDLIVATMTITEERKEQVDFSEVYFKAGQSLLVKKGSAIKGIDDVKKGTKVLAVKGSTSVDNIIERAPDANVLEFDNYQDAFSALKAGQGDVLTTDNAILYGMMAQDPGYEVVGEPFTDEPYGIAIKKGETELVDAVNAGLAAMKESGEYNEIYKQWIGEEPAE
ncbi:transporter substrate-binding domain-containing protein [Paenibacillus sp. N4]|uniref:transporter substrate-binding domain-containing protein n=1 Tax=Paenibacillus vietnamensis TaxID=2590547 RepID=UPI001CD0D008|nr:transporter substrate-binding domain-containing protein [Paenibacillus vietnamensis]MCA0754744.1 transporter substrate-binding domain-containing protein [Paenibacillus vietnamensis]